MSDAARLHRMAEAWRGLAERDRAIFAAVRFDDLDYNQAAKRVGCSVQEVEQTIARVLLALDRATNDGE